MELNWNLQVGRSHRKLPLQVLERNERFHDSR